MLISLGQIGIEVPSVSSWHLSANANPLAFASLTDFLRRSPDFVRQLLPNSRRAIAAINRAVRGGALVPPSATTRSRSLFSVVALAVDRGVLHLSGVDVAGAEIKRLRRRGAHASRIAEVLCCYPLPSSGHFHRRAYLGWLTVLGMLEPVRRGFRPLSDIDVSRLPRRITPHSAAEWLANAMPPECLEEIAALLRNVRAVRLPGRFIPNPVFGGLGPVTGSDGDWISGRTLVELKCVVRGVQSLSVAQLICYYVFDQTRAHGGDSFGFDRLALCLPRQGALIHGHVQDWLVAFGVPESVDAVKEISQWFSAT